MTGHPPQHPTTTRPPSAPPPTVEAARDWRSQSLSRLFEEQVRRTPNAPCVRDGALDLTYRELDGLANTLALRLLDRGVQPGDTVGVLAPRSAAVAVSFLGVLKTGAVYVPLDPAHPPTRLTSMARQVALAAVVASADVPDLGVARVALPDKTLPGSAPAPEVTRTGEDPAYVVFTSGTTGPPKAVVVPHRAPARLITGSAPPLVDSGPGDVWLATASPSFDVSCYEILGALLTGALLVPAHPHTLLAPDALAEQLCGDRISVMVLSAGVFHELAAWRPEMFRGLRHLISTADAVNPAALRAVLRHGPPSRLTNAYGPTENGIFSTAHDIRAVSSDATTISIGRPAAHSSAYVVLPDGNEAAPGESGELWVGGDGLAAGYHGDPDRTAERFVLGPGLPGGEPRLYRTGDRARLEPDGTIHLFGRLDRQVKVNGHRVELAEIEHTLCAHPAVSDAAAALHAGPDGRRRVLAWVLPEPALRGGVGVDRVAQAADLRAFLADRLPAFMIPAVLHLVDELPRNANGKIDTSQLSDATQKPTRPCADPPSTASEVTVAEVWGTLLARSDIGLDDNFASLGGQSLQAVHAVARLQRLLGLPPAAQPELIGSLLTDPTVRGFARSLDDARLRHAHTTAPPRQVLLTGATGYLGAHLLEELLRRPFDRVHCLIRARDEEQARRRLTANLHRQGLLPDEAVLGRVVPVPGDLSLPLFGMGTEEFTALAGDIDLLVHCGAQVNLLYPRSALEAANVQGTQTVLDLAAARNQAPVHHISTVDAPAAERGPSSGYAQSKHAAEMLVRSASGSGLAVATYRPSELSGPLTGPGVWPTSSFVSAVVHAIWHTASTPHPPLPLDLVPVDSAARAVLHLIDHAPATGEVHHLHNPAPADTELLAARMSARGRRIESVSYREWVARIEQMADLHPGFPLGAFLPMLAALPVMTVPTAGRSVFELAPTATDVDRAALSCPRVDAALLDRYLDRFEAVGFLTS